MWEDYKKDIKYESEINDRVTHLKKNSDKKKKLLLISLNRSLLYFIYFLLNNYYFSAELTHWLVTELLGNERVVDV